MWRSSRAIEPSENATTLFGSNVTVDVDFSENKKVTYLTFFTKDSTRCMTIEELGSLPDDDRSNLILSALHSLLWARKTTRESLADQKKVYMSEHGRSGSSGDWLCRIPRQYKDLEKDEARLAETINEVKKLILQSAEPSRRNDAWKRWLGDPTRLNRRSERTRSALRCSLTDDRDTASNEYRDLGHKPVWRREWSARVDRMYEPALALLLKITGFDGRINETEARNAETTKSRTMRQAPSALERFWGRLEQEPTPLEGQSIPEELDEE